MEEYDLKLNKSKSTIFGDHFGLKDDLKKKINQNIK